MKKFYILAIVLFSAGISPCVAQYDTLFSFKGTISPFGSHPWGSLTISGSKVYGMTSQGGANPTYGCVFSADTDGSHYKDILDFNNTNGGEPQFGTLVLSNGVLYGMTYVGGSNGGGLIFSVDTGGHRYKDMNDLGSNAPNPTGSLILVGKKLYGMTPYGGTHNSGNIFCIDSNGTGYRDMFDFSGSNGEYPYGTLTQVGNKLYGGATDGGAHNDGDVFSIDTGGTGFRDLYDFTGATGANPCWGGSLTLIKDKLFGLAESGGAHNYGAIFSIDTNGSGYTDMLDFTGSSGPNYGGWPNGSLTLWGNTLYGLAPDYGLNGGGSMFSIDTNGTGFKDMYDFGNTTGSRPYGSLTIEGNELYGMTFYVGISGTGDGVVFKYRDTAIHPVIPPNAINNLVAVSPSIRLYPNPNTGVFTLQIKNYELGITNQVEVFNMLGEKVYSATLSTVNSTLSINLSSQPSGVYLYRVLSETGDFVSGGKFVIQK